MKPTPSEIKAILHDVGAIHYLRNKPDAEAYTLKRCADAAKLRREMTFVFVTPDVLECAIYGHKVLIETAPGFLRLPTGNVSFEPNSSDDIYVCAMEQVIAYILAKNW